MRMRNLLAGLLAGCVCPGSGPAVAQEAPAVTMQAIVQAWKGRQDRVATARFTWTGVQSISKEGLGPPGEKNKPPEQGVTFDCKEVLMLDGDKMRFEKQGKIWDEEESKLVPNEKISTSDGTESRDFWPRGTKASDQGYINVGKRNSKVGSIHTRPVLMAFRALHPSMSSFRPEQYVIAPERGVVDGSTCVILEQRAQSADTSIVSIWVDPSRDYVINRYTLSRNGRVSKKLDIRYRQDDQCGWVPSA